MNPRANPAVITCVVFVAFLCLRGLVLYFSHPLETLDGAMQTWFAVHAFASGQQLGQDFQSYLGVTMMLFLLPFYMLFGSTLFSSSLAASTAVALGLLTMMHGLLRLMRGLTPGLRWWLVAAGFTFLAAIDDLSPGNSLRPVRSALPFLMLPLILPLLRSLRGSSPLRSGLLLGAVAGVGLIWSNDAGIPTFASLGFAILLCGTDKWHLTAKAVVCYAAGAVLTAGSILLVVTHGAPNSWLIYNFVAIPEDQIWYFAPWAREARVLRLSDVILIISAMSSKIQLAFFLLLISLVVAISRRLLARGAPIQLSAFVFLGLSAIGTALIPQLGGHVSNGYNLGLGYIGVFSPLIIFQKNIIGAIRHFPSCIRRNLGRVVMVSAGMVVIVSSANMAYTTVRTVAAHLDTVPIPELGFRVEPRFAEDVGALRQLRQVFDDAGVPNDARLQTTYPSALAIILDAKAPTPLGSIIHALGNDNRQRFIDVVADRRVAFATTVYLDHASWPDWNIRSNWGYFRALHLNYKPVAQNARHILWKRRAIPLPAPTEKAECRIDQDNSGASYLIILAPKAGHVEVQTKMATLPDTRHAEILTAIETSPFSQATGFVGWYDAPRYGIPTVLAHSMFVSVAANMPSKIKLEFLGKHTVKVASCTATVLSWPDMSGLPTFGTYVPSAGATLP